MGTPDVVLEMPQAYDVPAQGTVNYEYFYVPTNFTEPKWIQAQDAAPGHGRRETDRHRVVRQLRRQQVEPGSKMEVRWGEPVWDEMHYTGIMISQGKLR